jgi:hypothetical protein
VGLVVVLAVLAMIGLITGPSRVPGE